MNSPTFNASRIAAWLQVRRETVWAQYLSGVRATEERVANGGLSKFWAFDALPVVLQKRLDKIAMEHGYKDARRMLADEPGIPRMSLPLSECASHVIAKARLLQAAQARALERRNDTTAAEWQQMAVDDYVRLIGKACARHIMNLVHRTIQRAGVSADYSRLELYLPERPARTPAVQENKPATDLKPLNDAIALFADRTNPRPMELDSLWLRAFEFFRRNSQGNPRKVKRDVLDLLWSVPKIAASMQALRRNFDRKYAGWLQQDCNGIALSDKREDKRGIPTLPPYDPKQLALVKFATTKTHGYLAPALRLVNEMGLLTDPRMKKITDTATSKSYVPASLRNECTDREAWRVCSLGEKSADKLRPTLDLTYDGIFSMDCVTGDDLTAPVYVAVSDGNGWWTMTRGQTILICDFRSLKIIAWTFRPCGQYDALTVRSSLVAAFKEHGLPKFIYREGGIWRRSKLVNSLPGVTPPFSEAEIEIALEKRGTKFRTQLGTLCDDLAALRVQFRESYRANSKPVERVCDLVQYPMEAEPGYCGRNEEKDCPALVRKNLELVKTRQAHPKELGFYTRDEWCPRDEQREGRLDQIIIKYNATPQEGKRLRHPTTGDYMSPDTAFKLFENKDDPPVKLDATCEFYLSHMRLEVEVKKPSLNRRQFPCGWVEVRGHKYCDAQTGERIGKKLLAFFDPENPKTCTFTDLKMCNPFTVEELDEVNALKFGEQSKAALSRAQATVAGVKNTYRVAKRDSESFFRRNVVEPAVAQLSQHIEKQAEVQTIRRNEENSLRQQIDRRLESMGLSAGSVPYTREGLENLKLMQSGWTNEKEQA